MKSGIYQILNTVNSKRYIGSSYKLKFRFWMHKCELKQGYHGNKHLQNAYNKYGKDAFVFEVVEYCEVDKLIEREQFYIDSYDFNTLYNKRPLANSNTGVKHTEDFKAKKRMFKHTPEAIEAIRRSSTGRKMPPRTERHKKLLRGYRIGKEPTNKGTKGLTSANKTSFKKGQLPKNTQPFEIVSPNNILYIGVGISGFARCFDYHHSKLNLVRRGEKPQYKGWRLPKEGDVYEGYGFFGETPMVGVRV